MKKIIPLPLTASLLVSCDKLDDYFPNLHKTKSVTITVPGTSDPRLAGMADGTIAINPKRASDTAPY